MVMFFYTGDVSNRRQPGKNEGNKGEYTMKHRFVLPLLTIVFFTGALAAVQAGEHDTKHDRSKKCYSASGMMMDMHFNEIDSDGNNALHFQEFKSRFPTATEKSFNTLDTDRNGTLGHDEWSRFKKMHQSMQPYHKKEKFHGKDLPESSAFNARFSDMDPNGDGKVNMPEFRDHFPNRKKHGKVFNSVDLDQSGFLTAKEWNKFRKAHGLNPAK